MVAAAEPRLLNASLERVVLEPVSDGPRQLISCILVANWLSWKRSYVSPCSIMSLGQRRSAATDSFLLVLYGISRVEPPQGCGFRATYSAAPLLGPQDFTRGRLRSGVVKSLSVGEIFSTVLCRC